MRQELDFAGFDSDFDEAEYIIVGVPYDKTSSFRTGSRKAPSKIREVSYCFEPYLHEHSVSLDQLKLHDAGNIESTGEFDLLREDLNDLLQRAVEAEKFPIILGGEHSISPIAVEALKERYSELNVLTLDAHLDFRDTYEGLKHSHATVNRRISETVGLENMAIVGVRSISRTSSQEEKPFFLTSEEVKKDEGRVKQLLEHVNEPIYLSIDMDVLDPSFAPGVGNPEPFGLSSFEIKELIEELSDYIVGIDVVEVSPKYDEGEITSNLAARMVYEVLGSRENNK